LVQQHKCFTENLLDPDDKGSRPLHNIGSLLKNVMLFKWYYLSHYLVSHPVRQKSKNKLFAKNLHTPGNGHQELYQVYFMIISALGSNFKILAVNTIKVLTCKEEFNENER